MLARARSVCTKVPRDCERVSFIGVARNTRLINGLTPACGGEKTHESVPECRDHLLRGLKKVARLYKRQRFCVVTRQQARKSQRVLQRLTLRPIFLLRVLVRSDIGLCTFASRRVCVCVCLRSMCVSVCVFFINIVRANRLNSSAKMSARSGKKTHGCIPKCQHPLIRVPQTLLNWRAEMLLCCT